VIAERDGAEDDAGVSALVAETEVVFAETRLGEATSVGPVDDDHGAGDDLSARGYVPRRDHASAFSLDSSNGVHGCAR